MHEKPVANRGRECLPRLRLSRRLNSLSARLLIPLSKHIRQRQHVHEHHCDSLYVAAHLTLEEVEISCNDAFCRYCDAMFLVLLLLSHRYVRTDVNGFLVD